MSYQTPDNDIFDYLRAELSRMNAKLDRLSEDLSDIKRGMREDAAGLIKPDTKFRVPRPRLLDTPSSKDPALRQDKIGL